MAQDTSKKKKLRAGYHDNSCHCDDGGLDVHGEGKEGNCERCGGRVAP